MTSALVFLLALYLLAPVSGELWHIRFFGFDLLPSDVLLPALLGVWILQKIRHDPVLRIGRLGKAVLLFIFALFITFLLNAFRFPPKEIVIAGIYLGRLMFYLLPFFIVSDMLAQKKRPHVLQVLLGGMMLSMVLISILGFLQLKYFPSFLALGLDLKGWDPHIGRLLSTWFDPNFVGGYLAFILGISMALGLYFYRQRHRTFWFFAAISILGLIALYYTFSRSGYLALMMTLLVLAFFKSRRLFVAVIFLALLGFSLSPRVQERMGEGIESAKALFGLNSQEALDPTARLRVQSWNQAVEIIRDHPLIGIAYNRYPYEINQRGYGLLSDHDAGGSDSSLLTVWATSGLFGLLSALAIGFTAVRLGLRRIWKKSDFKSYLSAGLLASFTGVFVHSFFVNSLLFVPMMVYLWTALGFLEEV